MQPIAARDFINAIHESNPEGYFRESFDVEDNPTVVIDFEVRRDVLEKQFDALLSRVRQEAREKAIEDCMDKISKPLPIEQFNRLTIPQQTRAVILQQARERVEELKSLPTE